MRLLLIARRKSFLAASLGILGFGHWEANVTSRLALKIPETANKRRKRMTAPAIRVFAIGRRTGNPRLR